MMKKIINPKHKYKIAVLIGIIFTLVGSRWLDPDFGWHYKLGEIIYNTGIPETDPFTYTMPDYLFVDYEWGTNVLFYLIYNFAGYSGITFIYAFLVSIIPIILTPKRYEKYWLLPAIIIWTTLISFFSARPQVISWFFLAILFRMFFENKLWEKYKYLLPLLFLFWVNLHGSYPLGIILLGIYVFFSFIENPENWFSNLMVLVASLLVLLVNPYGIRNLEEVVIQMKYSGFYRKTVQEWQLSLFAFNPGFIQAFTFSASLLYLFKNKFNFKIIIIFLLLLTMAFSSVRHIPIFVVFGSSIIFMGLYFLEHTYAKKDKIIARRLKLAYQFSIAISLLIFILSISLTIYTMRKLNENHYYPQKAVEYLKTQNIEGEVFSTYNWGGYLIWKYPEKKVFVDGRVPGWEAYEGEPMNAYVIYLDMSCGKTDINKIFNEYNINTLLIEKNEQSLDNNKNPIANKILSSLTYCLPDEKTLTERLDDGWEETYTDEVAKVLQRQENE